MDPASACTSLWLQAQHSRPECAAVMGYISGLAAFSLPEISGASPAVSGVRSCTARRDTPDGTGLPPWSCSELFLRYSGPFAFPLEQQALTVTACRALLGFGMGGVCRWLLCGLCRRHGVRCHPFVSASCAQGLHCSCGASCLPAVWSVVSQPQVLSSCVHGVLSWSACWFASCRPAGRLTCSVWPSCGCSYMLCGFPERSPCLVRACLPPLRPSSCRSVLALASSAPLVLSTSFCRSDFQ